MVVLRATGFDTLPCKVVKWFDLQQWGMPGPHKLFIKSRFEKKMTGHFQDRIQNPVIRNTFGMDALH
jgi:hypothetical protein